MKGGPDEVPTECSHHKKNISYADNFVLYLFPISDISASTPVQWTRVDISLRCSRHCEHLKQQTVVPNLLRRAQAPLSSKHSPSTGTRVMSSCHCSIVFQNAADAENCRCSFFSRAVSQVCIHTSIRAFQPFLYCLLDLIGS